VTAASNKAKGRNWETSCVSWLIEHGYPFAERRRLTGAQDKGDIAGVPGVVWECKSSRTYSLPQWVREAEVERANDGVPVGLVWAKQNGKTDPGQGFIVMTPLVVVNLLQRAGHVSAPHWERLTPG